MNRISISPSAEHHKRKQVYSKRILSIKNKIFTFLELYPVLQKRLSESLDSNQQQILHRRDQVNPSAIS